MFNKTVLIGLLLGSMTAPAFAENSSKEEGIGVGLGVVIGGVAGGPVGAIIGAAFVPRSATSSISAMRPRRSERFAQRIEQPGRLTRGECSRVEW